VPKLYRRNNHRPEFHHLPWGRPLPQPAVEPPPNQSSPRYNRRSHGNRSPQLPPIGRPRKTPKNLPHPLRATDPLVAGKGWPNSTSAADRARRAAARATRPTRRQILAAVRDELELGAGVPGVEVLVPLAITRNDPIVRHAYAHQMDAWRRRVGA
jgi:hypothetical protein